MTALSLVLAASVQQATSKLRDQIEQFDEAKASGRFNSQRPFKVVTQPEQIKGLLFSDFMVVGDVPQELIDTARSAMR